MYKILYNLRNIKLLTYQVKVQFNKTTEIYKMNSHYHSYLPDNVSRIMTLIESKDAIYRGLATNTFLHISRNAHDEYDTNRGLPVYFIFSRQFRCRMYTLIQG